MEHKNLSVTLKADAEGSVKAVFSTLGVIDKDGDVTVRGAFTPGDRVNIAAWGHNWGSLPAGDGTIAVRGDDAIFEGDFYLGTPQGDATYQTLKQRYERGFSQEWSFGFDVLEAEPGVVDGKDVRLLKKLKVYEVSPVMVGAGENTRTLAVKGIDEEADEVESALVSFIKRMSDRSEFRQKQGRALSAANRARLASVSESMNTLLGQIGELLEDDEPEKASSDSGVVSASEESVVSAELPEDVKQTLDRYLKLQALYSA